jgi:hypothetical protein
MLKKVVHEALYRFLLAKGKRIVPTTDPVELRSFMDLTRPIDSGHGLIRCGANGDGGYLLPNDLDGLAACFSPGVSDVADFELALAERGVPCFLADYSVLKAPVEHPLVSFERKFLGIKNDDVFVTLNSWVEQHASDQSEFILQMDIEGAEYEVLFDTSEEVLKKFRIMVIEFHHLDKLLLAGDFKLFNLIFTKINKYFEVVHIHPNNCAPAYEYLEFRIPPIMEFTFLRRDRVKNRQHEVRFPHPLDQANIEELADFPLPKCWYSAGQ